MKHENWDIIELIFHQALVLPSEERNSFIHRQCFGNDLLISEIKALLDAFENEAQFLDESVFEFGLEVLNGKPGRDLTSSTIGFYQVGEKLGSGGMGEVYKALDTKLNRLVALKFLSELYTDNRWAQRQLVKEAQSVAMLEHPNICAVYGIEEINGHNFIVMPYVEGKTLAESILETEISGERVVSIARQITAAVAYAHSHGIIHRDLKPGNIMISPDGQVKVLDFGLATTVGQKHKIEPENDSNSYPHNGLIRGTVSYMSPEQLRGEKLDYRTDIFSLGIIFNELIARENPFIRRSQAETITAILTDHSPALKKNAPNLPDFLINLTEKCLQKNKDDRFQSVAEVLLEFDQANITNTRKIISRPRPEFFVKVALAATILLFIFAGKHIYTGNRQQKTLAVLPISFSQSSVEKEYLADGLTQNIIDELSKLSELDVKSETLITRYKEKEVEPQVAGKELNVDVVFVADISERLGKLVLSSKLVRVSDGELIDQFESEFVEGKLIKFPKEVVLRIISKVASGMTDADKNKLEKKDTESEEAKNLYLKGRFYLKKRSESDDLYKAISFFTDAKDIDLNYAKAWAGLADAYIHLSTPGVKGAITPEKAIASAKKAALRATALDPDLPEAYNSLGLISSKYEWNWNEAENYFRAAVNRDEEFLPAHFGLIDILKLQERYDEALAEAEKIKLFDPFSISSDVQIALIYYRKREYAKTDKILSELLQKFPDNMRVKYVRVYLLLKTERFKEAIEILEPIYQSGSEENKILASAPLGFAFARTGRREEALKITATLEKLRKSNYVPAQEKALVYVGLGDYDKTFENLKLSCDERFFSLPGWINEPIVEEIKSDSRFAEIKKCVNL